MPLPHKQPQFLRYCVFIGKIDPHKLSRCNEDDKNENSEDQVKPRHYRANFDIYFRDLHEPNFR